MSIRRDQHHSMFVLGSDTDSGTDNHNFTSSGDLRDYLSVECIISFSGTATAFTAANHVGLGLQHSDDNSTWSDVTAGDLIGNGANSAPLFGSMNGAQTTRKEFRVGYVGTKRYIRAKSVYTGTHSATDRVFTVLYIGMDKRDQPTADQN